MKILVGWWSTETGELVDIPGFDRVQEPLNWLPVYVEVEQGQLNDLLRIMAVRR